MSCPDNLIAAHRRMLFCWPDSDARPLAGTPQKGSASWPQIPKQSPMSTQCLPCMHLPESLCPIAGPLQDKPMEAVGRPQRSFHLLQDLLA